MHMSDYLTLYLNNKIKVKNNSYIAVLHLVNPIFNPLSTNLISWVNIPLRIGAWVSEGVLFTASAFCLAISWNQAP